MPQPGWFWSPQFFFFCYLICLRHINTFWISIDGTNLELAFIAIIQMLLAKILLFYWCKYYLFQWISSDIHYSNKKKILALPLFCNINSVYVWFNSVIRGQRKIALCFLNLLYCAVKFFPLFYCVLYSWLNYFIIILIFILLSTALFFFISYFFFNLFLLSLSSDNSELFVCI